MQIISGQKRTVVLESRADQQDIARRPVDFLSGVAQHKRRQDQEGCKQHYIITPYNVDIMGDLIDELENSGMYF